MDAPLNIFTHESSSQNSTPLIPHSSSNTMLTIIKPTILILSFTILALLTIVSSSSPSSNPTHISSSHKLSHPTVILISCDGFRFGYQYKTDLPNINFLISNGTEAQLGLIPVFPTLTFPNHYSIVTGLYPSYHGIISNHFIDPITGSEFSMASKEPKWWLGEPIWETVVNHGFNAAAYFWPGSEVKKGSWTCPDKFCHKYNKSTPFESRVDSVLGYFDMEKDQIPILITLYFEEPDSQGHKYGPDDVEVTEAIARVDSMIGRLITGLKKRNVFDDVNIILVSDHGMVGICEKKYIFLDDLAPWIKVDASWVRYYSPLFLLEPPGDMNSSEVVAKMNEGLSFIENGEKLKVFLKEDLPERLHYWESYRIPSIVGLLEEGYKVQQSRSSEVKCGGDHGYDNEYFSMRTVFVGHGPRFEKGRKVSSFENVEIYNVIASILKLKGAPNNGSDSFPELMLVPEVGT